MAHDSWLEQRAGTPQGRIELALTTGVLFPLAETPIAPQALVDRACTGAAGTAVPLHAGRIVGEALLLHAQAPRSGEALRGCHVQTTTFEVEVAPHLVPVYLREIAAPPAVFAAWAEQQRLGVPWIERYTKHARISFDGALAAAGAAERAEARAMALDIEIEGDEPPRAGRSITFRVWRDGKPLPGLAVELRGDTSRFGLWRRTDAEGRASVPVPLAGRWVLRATDLRPVIPVPGGAGGHRWESRFVTHTFTAAAAPAPQPPNSSSANARSTNQASASNAINAEPPTSTAPR